MTLYRILSLTMIYFVYTPVVHMSTLVLQKLIVLYGTSNLIPNHPLFSVFQITVVPTPGSRVL